MASSTAGEIQENASNANADAVQRVDRKSIKIDTTAGLLKHVLDRKGAEDDTPRRTQADHSSDNVAFVESPSTAREETFPADVPVRNEDGSGSAKNEEADGDAAAQENGFSYVSSPVGEDEPPSLLSASPDADSPQLHQDTDSSTPVARESASLASCANGSGHGNEDVMCSSPVDSPISSEHSFSEIREKGLASQAISDVSSDSVDAVPISPAKAKAAPASPGSQSAAPEGAEGDAKQIGSQDAARLPPLHRPSASSASAASGSTTSRKVSGGSAGSRSYTYKETLDAHSKEMGDGSRVLNQYKILEMIGQGAYGTVHRAVLVDDPSAEFAIKEFSKTRLRKTHRATNMSRRQGSAGRGRRRGFGIRDQRGVRRPDVLEPAGLEKAEEEERKDPLYLIRHELAILKKLHHPYVVKLFEVLDDPSGDSLYMVFEHCPGGRIIEVRLHEQVEPLKESKAWEYFRQIALGVEYLHHNEIVHRDIKPDNILLSADKKSCRIVDFGVSEMFVKPGDDRLRKSAGSPAFMSPELCTAGHGDYHGRADDMWSLGVTLYCIVVGKLPFDRSQFLDLYQAIREDEPDYPAHLSPQLVDLLKQLLAKNPDDRMTIDRSREHPWVTREGTEPMLSKEKNLVDVVEEITAEDVERAIVRTGGIFAVVRAIQKFKKRASSSKRTSSVGSTTSEASSVASGVLSNTAEVLGASGLLCRSPSPSVAISPWLSSTSSIPNTLSSATKEVANAVTRLAAPREGPETEDQAQTQAPAAAAPGWFTMSPAASMREDITAGVNLRELASVSESAEEPEAESPATREAAPTATAKSSRDDSCHSGSASAAAGSLGSSLGGTAGVGGTSDGGVDFVERTTSSSSTVDTGMTSTFADDGGQSDDTGRKEGEEEVASVSAPQLLVPKEVDEAGDEESAPHATTKRGEGEGKEEGSRPQGRPRLLDGPLVASPAVTRIKTPEGASEFYKGRMPKFGERVGDQDQDDDEAAVEGGEVQRKRAMTKEEEEPGGELAVDAAAAAAEEEGEGVARKKGKKAQEVEEAVAEFRASLGDDGDASRG